MILNEYSDISSSFVDLIDEAMSFQETIHLNESFYDSILMESIILEVNDQNGASNFVEKMIAWFKNMAKAIKDFIAKAVVKLRDLIRRIKAKFSNKKLSNKPVELENAPSPNDVAEYNRNTKNFVNNVKENKDINKDELPVLHKQKSYKYTPNKDVQNFINGLENGSIILDTSNEEAQKAAKEAESKLLNMQKELEKHKADQKEYKQQLQQANQEVNNLKNKATALSKASLNMYHEMNNVSQTVNKLANPSSNNNNK